MSNHDAVPAVPISTPIDDTLLRNVLVKRMPYALADSDDPETLVETDPDTGVKIIDILYHGRTFHIDLTDTTTAHDGVSCLVTAGGVRYKLAVGTDVVGYAVLSRVTAPPATSPPPGVGAAYLVKPSATDDFAAEDNNVAVLTARGWEFIDFGIGRLIYVEDEDAFYRRKTDGSWSAGFGNAVLGAGTVAPSALTGGGGRVLWEVENQTTNAPPGAVTDGVAYIIGSSPTGAWAGQAAKIAHGENGAWVVYAPAAGWLAYDKAAGQNYQYSGSAWLSATGRLNKTLRLYTASTTWSKPARLAYIRVRAKGGGGTGGAAGNGSSGSTSSFGAHCSATGGGGATSSGSTPGTAGTGSGGDINLTGAAGIGPFTTGGGSTGDGAVAIGGIGAGDPQPKGHGGSVAVGSGNSGSGGGGGGCADKVIDAASLASTETVTVGSAGANNGCVYVEEYTYA